MDVICRKLFKDGLTLTFSAFRFPLGDKSSVQGFQFYVLKFFPLSKRILEGFELVSLGMSLTGKRFHVGNQALTSIVGSLLAQAKDMET